MEAQIEPYLVVSLDPVPDRQSIGVDLRHDRQRRVVAASDRAVRGALPGDLVVAVAVGVAAERFIYRIARIVPERRADSEPTPGIPVAAARKGVPVVGVREPIVEARVEVVVDTLLDDVAAVGETGIDIARTR